jgi:hypothetical protein
MRAVGLSAALALAACAGGPSASVGGDPNVTGDENGGKIVDAIGPQQSQAMRTVTGYCARHDKKGFITRMDFDARTITFECRRQTRTG